MSVFHTASQEAKIQKVQEGERRTTLSTESAISSSQSRQHPWRVLFSILTLQFAFGFIYAWGSVVPEVHLQDHWVPLLTSAVFSAGPLGYGTGMMISGRLAERYPPRLLCWAGVGLMLIG